MKKPALVIGLIAFTGMLLLIGASNYSTTVFGFIPVGFGFTATAGTLFAGLSLALRDLLQDTWGRLAVIFVIAFGTLLSFVIAAPEIALASAAAFGLAELLDFAVYSPLRKRATRFGDKRWAVAVVASNAVGAVVDTVVFLGIAFGLSSILPSLGGQLVGKGWATVAYLIVGAAVGQLIKRKIKNKA